MISAGIHHLVLDQNLTVLKKNLIPDEVIRRMLEDSSMEQFDLLADNQEERIQRFIECLQECSIEDYKYFIKLLYKTKQEPLITKLVTSCKTLLHITLIFCLIIILYFIKKRTSIFHTTFYYDYLKCFNRCRATYKYHT